MPDRVFFDEPEEETKELPETIQEEPVTKSPETATTTVPAEDSSPIAEKPLKVVKVTVFEEEVSTDKVTTDETPAST